MDVALIGCGFIGTLISEKISAGKIPIRLKFLLDRNSDKVRKIQQMFEDPPEEVEGIDNIVSSNVDLVIEAASIQAVHSFAEKILESGKDMLILSVGAFSTLEFYQNLEELCNKKNARIYLPSGAIGALDAVSSAAFGELEEVELTTIKNPMSFEGAPYIMEHKIVLSDIMERTVIFSGNATAAVAGFPANVNVAIALSLAGIGAENTKVRIVADPDIHLNVHEITAKGNFGRLTFRTENIASPDNPKTSLLAALSAVSMLKKITNPIRIG